MRASRPVRSILASVLVALLAVACSPNLSETDESRTPASRGPTPTPRPVTLTDYPSGFPTVYVSVVDAGPKLLTPVDGGLRHDVSGRLTAEDGNDRPYTRSWVENASWERRPRAAASTTRPLHDGGYRRQPDGDLPDWVAPPRGDRSRRRLPEFAQRSSTGWYVTRSTAELRFEFTAGPGSSSSATPGHWEADGHSSSTLAASASPSPSESPARSRPGRVRGQVTESAPENRRYAS